MVIFHSYVKLPEGNHEPPGMLAIARILGGDGRCLRFLRPSACSAWQLGLFGRWMTMTKSPFL